MTEAVENTVQIEAETEPSNGEPPSPVNELRKSPTAIQAPTYLQKQVGARKYSRKRDFYSSDGLIRENARLLAKLHGKKIIGSDFELMSKGLNRQFQMVNAKEQIEAIRTLAFEIHEARLSKNGASMNGFALTQTLQELLQ